MDEEEQLKRAIELSLQESQPQSQSYFRSQAPNENQHEGDEEDEDAQFQRDLAAAIEASKSEAEAKARSGSRPARGQREAKSTFPDTLQQSEIAKNDNVSTSTPYMSINRAGNNAREEERNEEIGLGRQTFLRERSKMEKERLERVGKMKAQGSEKRRREEGDSEEIVIGTGSAIAGASGFSSGTGTDNQAISPPTKRQRSSPVPPSIPTMLTTNGRVTSVAKNNKDKVPVRGASSDRKLETKKYGDEVFWDGELRQIANRLVDRDKNIGPTFRLSEIIGPRSEITLAILSSYSNNMDWLYTFFDPTTPIIVVNQPGEDGNSGLRQLAPNLLMTKPFIRNGRGCMHTKVSSVRIMLLFYKDGRLRVVVPTANFVEYDWRDIENTAWVQDVAIRQTTIRHDPKAIDFPGTLQRVLHTLNVPAALTKLLDDESFELPIEALSELRMRWDWSKVRVKLVASIAGRHEGWEHVSKTGHPALMKAVQELDARPSKRKQLVLECQGMYLYGLIIGFQCWNVLQAMDERVLLFSPWREREDMARSTEEPQGEVTMAVSQNPFPVIADCQGQRPWYAEIKLMMFPFCCVQGGGTMFCRKAQWEAKNFPRELFYDSNSKRGRVLMHSKMIIGYFKEKSSSSVFSGRRVGATKDDVDLSSGEEGNNADGNDASVGKEKVIGWAYIGSHNFTPSAWGTLSGSESNPSLNIVNYELGIVIPLRSFEELEKVACWKRPARQYVKGVDRPWMQDEMREGMAVMQD
ncbi:phospholipase D/nuclease [Sanghuangporus baumii]|uniref:Phospholipase D/nuclease n=1 Tax=Sanghuangporus baumii TaxID=108892 RepID=A0A9Q5HU78_SANBA|nr:phospholipase D/nuclease [Sanghuangporus baumii]